MPAILVLGKKGAIDEQLIQEMVVVYFVDRSADDLLPDLFVFNQ
jgi:hypothetical protein